MEAYTFNKLILRLANDFMTKILHIGGEDVRMRIPILSLLQSNGFQVGALGCNDGTAFESTKISYYDYFLNRWISPLDDIKTKKQLAKLFIETKPDLIHLFDTKPGVITPKVAKNNSVKVVVRTVTGMGYIFSSDSLLAKFLKPFYRIAQKRAIAYTDMVIFQNRDDQEYFEKYNLLSKEKSVLVASSGLQVDKFIEKQADSETKIALRQQLGFGEKDIIVTLIARLVKDKGILEFLEAAKILTSKNNIKFLLIGPLGSEGKQAVSKSTIQTYSKFVNYIGPVNNVAEILSLSDIFVLPTYYREGLPRILLEAGALGLPLITTDMPGCRDVVKDGWNGLLVPIRDSHALANAIDKLSSNEKLRLKMGAKNPSFIKDNFDLSIVAKAYIQIYRELLSKHEN